ncbi:MAG: osmoprotectant transport system substrate-binding protein [Rubrobacteraceae bacterium]|jgi:osmoprotectant transport system substrate-binding protein|nr:osmoprotectant transport system substrate-binding protein [Rubrobacteraceae bacterium]
MLVKPVNLLRMAGLVAVVVMLAVGCSGGGLGGGGGGSIAQNYDLSGTKFTVGSKQFTEQLVLGNITKQALEAAGATVNDQIGLAGSDAARQALTSGEIDMYWEYLGTAWITYLGETGNIPKPAYETVADRDRKENGIEWLKPAPEENSYAIATNRQTADKYGLQTLSDLGPFIEQNPDEATICVGNEFAVRDDGLPGLQKAYGWEFSEVNRIQDGLVYDQVANGDQCNFGSVFTTDGRIANLDLVLLEDDQEFFPAYNAALTIREDVFQQNQQLADLFAPISELLTTEQMQQLNLQVDVDGQPPEQVAEQFLRDNGFIG